MRYFSAVVNEDEIKACVLEEPKQILASFHYFKNKVDLLKKCVQNQYTLFIDSGAFSAENSGGKIDIDEYCKFLLEVRAPYYASLDVIGNAKATRDNYDYMVKEYGLKPIPTFHMGSRVEDLYPLLDKEYIALGGLVFSSGIMNHCDEVWRIIIKEAPHLRVHGFGLTNIDLMARYPWYSVDSSSFKSCKRFGRQPVLNNDITFSTLNETEFQAWLNERGYFISKETDNKLKWFVYDYFGAKAYKIYASHLTETHKLKDFNYLISQTKLFE